jgi:protein CpxP
MMAFHKSLAPLFGLALLVAAPLARSQDASPNAAPPPPADQPEHHHRPGPAMMYHRLMSQVSNLTDDETAQVKGIVKDFAGQAKALRKDDSLSDDERRQKFMDLMKATNEKIRALLTPDQQKQFDEAVAKARARFGHHRGGDQGGDNAPPPPPPAPPAST